MKNVPWPDAHVKRDDVDTRDGGRVERQFTENNHGDRRDSGNIIVFSLALHVLSAFVVMPCFPNSNFSLLNASMNTA